MLTDRRSKVAKKLKQWSWTVVLVFFTLSGWSQDEVSILRAVTVSNATVPNLLTKNAQPFSFQRNLIFFPAKVNGKPGNFILDTGAPSLLLNNRGVKKGSGSNQLGIAAGGSVNITNQRVESFEMGGVDLGSRWALTLDLRAMEQRTGQQIDGYVGHDLIRNTELRIDFPAKSFQLLSPERHPDLAGIAPRTIFKFEYVDHLPVITLRVGKHKLRFAIDTGAGVNLLDDRFFDLVEDTGKEMNVQGLDGGNKDCPVVRLDGLSGFKSLGQDKIEFVSMNLDHLQEPGLPPLAGIIGSASLKDFVVGINYRHRKIYLW